MTTWRRRRKVAASYIHVGRALLRMHSDYADAISREDNNRVFDMGQRLIGTGRRIAMGYELEAWTTATYWAHLKATRPKRDLSELECDDCGSVGDKHSPHCQARGSEGQTDTNESLGLQP
jgi:hypothetical protein